MIIAIDCDLRSMTMVGEDRDGSHLVLMSRADPALAVSAAVSVAGTVLYEIAGPAYARIDSRGATAQQTRWAIYNAAWAAKIDRLNPGRVLVAPSSKWTKGYDVKTRHALAKAKGKNKDIRECESMLWFFAQNPAAWAPLSTYLENL